MHPVAEVMTTDHVNGAAAIGSVTTWSGMTRVATSPRGISAVWLPRWSPGTVPLAIETPEIVVQQGDGAEAERHLRQALRELAEYFAGERQTFTVALDPSGPAFFQRVWAEVARVPYGETRSYAEIARAVGAPAATRAVGAANGANPVAPFVPCHRIVGSDGRLTGYGPGLPLKQRLLVMEGAVPASPDDYDAWIARIRAGTQGNSIYIGVRGANIYCLPTCAHNSRQRLLPNRIFHTSSEALAAGFQPCRVCHPSAEFDLSAEPTSGHVHTRPDGLPQTSQKAMGATVMSS